MEQYFWPYFAVCVFVGIVIFYRTSKGESNFGMIGDLFGSIVVVGIAGAIEAFVPGAVLMDVIQGVGCAVGHQFQ
jgi:hypothetical protein